MTTTPPPLVGLIGRKRSGKDSVAAVLAERRGYVRVAFADPLRAAALALDPIVGRPALPGVLYPHDDVRLTTVVSALGWERAKDTVPEVRRILQRLGTDAIRALDESFWVRTAMHTVAALRAQGIRPDRSVYGGSPVVVTDCRFPNEARQIRYAGGILVRVVRPGFGDDGDTHPSETALDDYADDVTILNDGTLDDLAATTLLRIP